MSIDDTDEFPGWVPLRTPDDVPIPEIDADELAEWLDDEDDDDDADFERQLPQVIDSLNTIIGHPMAGTPMASNWEVE